MFSKILIFIVVFPHLRFALQSSLSALATSPRSTLDVGEENTADAMSSDGLYNAFLLATLVVAVMCSNPAVAKSFAWFWLLASVAGSVWNAATTCTTGRYHAFLVVVLTVGLLDPNPVTAEAFAILGLSCVIASSLRYAWIGMQPSRFFQCAMPAVLALTAVLARI